jgi:ABC-type transport system substrate-binding protein
VNALETGAVDFALIPMKDYDYIESLGTCTLQVLNTGSSLIAMYNMGKNSPLHSVEARRAVSYAINCQAIIDVAYSGKAELIDWPASESMTEMQDRYLNMDEIYSDRYNLEKAQALAEQSGLVGKTLRIVTNGDPKFVTAAEVIQNGLESLKVKSEIINYDQASYFSFLMSDNEYEIAIQTPVAPGSVTCDVFGNYPVFIPQDWSGPEREAYIVLGAKANATADLAERQDVVYELLKLFNKHHLWYGLCEDPNLCAYNKDLKNVQIDNSGVWILQDMYF